MSSAPSDPTKASIHCVVCSRVMLNWFDEDIWHCRNCSHWSSSFPASATKDRPATLDEAHRRVALQGVRKSNAVTILDEINSCLKVENPTLCDIGTAHGWFLAQAETAGYKAIGIEPDQQVAQVAIQHGLPVRVGAFPQCLATSEQFDVLTFNDVFEHLPEPLQILDACRAHMRPGGLFVIVLPSSRGILFRMACELRRIGVRGPWERLWQRSFPCPHCHYYSPSNLEALMNKEGFQLRSDRDLPSFHYRGLWSRLRMESEMGFLRVMLYYLSLLAVSPILRLGRSDITMQIYCQAGQRD